MLFLGLSKCPYSSRKQSRLLRNAGKYFIQFEGRRTVLWSQAGSSSLNSAFLWQITLSQEDGDRWFRTNIAARTFFDHLIGENVACINEKPSLFSYCVRKSKCPKTSKSHRSPRTFQKDYETNLHCKDLVSLRGPSQLMCAKSFFITYCLALTEKEARILRWHFLQN